MSGVRSGSRLEQLQQLRARLDHEIAQERRRLVLEGHPVPADPKPTMTQTRGLHDSDVRTHELLHQLGVTPRQVKEWAHEQGLLDAVVRGRVARRLVYAYADAHREDHP